MSETPSALTGITVVDLSNGLAAALATMFLADHGARVVRIVFQDEDIVRRPDIFAVYDRGKEVVHLDHLAAADSVGSMFAGADVVIDDLPPGSSLRDQLGIGDLRTSNHRLVHCSITAYGSDGPLKDEPADHDLVAARTGILASQPSYRQGPVHVVHPVAYVGAALLATMGIAAALFRRLRTGLGSRVETSLMAGALLYSPKAMSDALPARRMNMSPQGGGPFYSVFECSDGTWLQIGCIHSGFVDLAAAVIGVAGAIAANPEFGDGRWPRTESARERLFDMVADTIRTRPAADWIKDLRAADVPCDVSRSAQEAMSDPQILHCGLVQELDDPILGRTQMTGLPINLSGTPGRVTRPRPAVAGEEDIKPPERAVNPAGPLNKLDMLPDLPLSGIRIMEMTNVIAGPVAGRLLADLGADMIKFESLDGDISRPAGGAGFIAYNTNKRSVSANTRTVEGREVARRLAATSDAILANMRPGATDRMGLDSTSLAGLNPDLIESHITAYGWDGPYSQRPGVDPIAQAITGLQHAQGGYDGPPVYLSALAPCDYTGGALGALGTILALVARERFGVAQRVNTSLLSAGAIMCANGFMDYEGKPPRQLPDRDQMGVGPLRRLYPVSDGWIAIAADSPSLRSTVAEQTAWLSNTSAAEVKFAHMTQSEALALFSSHHIPCAPVVADYGNAFFVDPQAAINMMKTEFEHPVLGIVKLSGNLVSFDGSPTLPNSPTPLLGQHTREILMELEYTPTEIGNLYDQGVVKTESPHV